MRVEKIELIGFKSFADKTVFSLHPGITCIVGPNGCGKSNIVDAFRWVLGEQSAKSLRGEKMEEVIFNGSSSKKQKGMSEVTLIVSGLSAATPSGNGDNGQSSSDLVSVSRRLYRSGESEYLINKQPCRLKDLKDVFLDTGLDFRSYSILEQGRINAILNSKPLERRFIIEEVAGVMKYKVRKAEALSKLESSRLNLARISDIITEVKKQINILDRLAKKAERYKKLRAELNAIELKIARREYQQITDSLFAINEEYGTLKEKEAVLGAGITEIENRTQTRRINLVEKEKALDLVQQDFQTVQKDIAEITRLISVSGQDIINYEEFHTKFLQQAEEIVQRIAGLTARYSELEANGSRISEEIEAATAMLREKTDAFKTIEQELSEKEEAIEEKRRQIFAIAEKISRTRNEKARHQISFDSLEKKETLAITDSEESRKVLAEVESAIAAAEAEILGRNNEAMLLKEKREIVGQELSSQKAKLENFTRTLGEAREEFASFSSRLDSLKEIVLDKPTRELLALSGNVRLLASVSDVFEVQAEYEKAIESALSEKADSFVVEASEDIEHAIDDLKGKSLDKASFITVAPPPFTLPSQIPSGIVGKALDFVRIKEGYAKVAENLLGNIMVMRDVKAALELRQSTDQFLLVTISGEVIEPSGAVIVGGERGIFRRKREIRELEQLIEEKRAAIEAMNHEMRLVQESIQQKEEEIKSVENALHRFEKELSLARMTVETYFTDKERIGKKLSYLTIELEQIIREKESLKGLMARAEEEAAAQEAEKAGMEQQMQGLQEGISQKKEEIELFRAEVTELRMQTATNREKLEAVRNEMESSIRTREELGRKKDEVGNEIESNQTRISQRRAEIRDHEERLKTRVTEADGLSREIAGRKEEIALENEELFAVDQELKSLRQNASATTARIAELDVARAEHKMRIENIAKNIMTNYEAEISQIELMDVTPEEEEKAVELSSKIQEIGPVNLGTLDEYEELRTRYEFMTKQQDDLNKSIAELEEAITKINGTTRKKLREAFDALRTKFAEVFTTLFGGGRAELVLTDESNILETGIDIIAQPPGKKVQNIHLLSGGEQALTALSLQFASFLIKPTPLCILDEADAPLDESNTERYAKMLQGLSSGTQFIVVTHNRTTMSVAQHLYGITMEEAGVSKVISMQFAEV
ncbi:MAG: chromosome segregation protein SMC [Nitrospirae bacterium]|nr:chromosome segregation protein SMC [Nitrospirota bacterium]